MLPRPVFGPLRSSLVYRRFSRVPALESSWGIRPSVKKGLWLGLRWTAIAYTFVALGSLAYMGVEFMHEEQERPTPEEWKVLTKWSLRNARKLMKAVDDGQLTIEWPLVAKYLRYCLLRLEDPKCDGKGIVKLEEGLDVSTKSWPWKAGYFEVIMACAVAAEHLDSSVIDTKSLHVFPKAMVIGHSNPDPIPTPIFMPPAPREEDCVRVFDPPEVFYKRVLATKGFTTEQKLEAALAYANWMERQGQPMDATELHEWAIDLAKNSRSPETDALNGENKMSSNLLRATAALGMHQARVGNPSVALPILLSALQARRSATSPLPQLATGSARCANGTTDSNGVVQWLHRALTPPTFPPPPPSGDAPLAPRDHLTCEDSELMLYIAQIWPSATEALDWARQGVTTAKNCLQFDKDSQSKAEQLRCLQCLEKGAGMWKLGLHNQITGQTQSNNWLGWLWQRPDGKEKEMVQEMKDVDDLLRQAREWKPGFGGANRNLVAGSTLTASG
ncbi:hypothetical protein K470DRAFT_214902 [Piedraia hortae CBS 480.64]|uniref:MFS maltose permease n=1 Tax=Piedraia hortae CBS 480.64 TaxID=1314780 RepID=A0A6A7C2C3_9PEZI|nr:hypothetical protein K470DRAFT_214902 [Piedraia hortae CBS 480.64]